MKSPRSVPLSVVSLAALSLSLSTLGCADGSGPVEVEQKQADIINGNPLGVDTVGTPAFNWSDPPSRSGTCSGTLIRQDWVLTAHHCVSHNGAETGGTALPASAVNAKVLNGGNNPPGRLIVRHPTLDVALVKMTAAPTGPSGNTFPNWISLVSDASSSYGS